MCDGDKALVLKDRNLTTVAKRNMKGIVPLAYDLKKAKGEILSADNLYQGMCYAYTGGNIGVVSNNITKVWNSGEIGEEQINVVKWLCLYNNAVIDYAKTLWKPEPPVNVAETIRSYTRANVPSFFVYAKDKLEEAVELPNNSTMNRISLFIPSSRVSYSKSIGKCDWRMMINQKSDYSVNDDNPVIISYNYWLRHQYAVNSDNDNIKDDDCYATLRIRQKIIDESKKDIDYIVNSLVAYTYTVTKSSNKKLLWACFGDEIVNNLKINLYGKGKICPICGKRFIGANRALTCSEKCSKELHRQAIYEKKYGF